MPCVQAESAVRIAPFAPIGSADTVEAAVAVMSAPLAVRQAQGIAVFADQATPVVQAEFAVRI